jgi:hypothetical protein
MKKNIFIAIMLLSVYLMACRPTKQINKAIAPKETLPVPENQTKDDSLKQINDALTQLKAHYIDFRTFQCKNKSGVFRQQRKESRYNCSSAHH